MEGNVDSISIPLQPGMDDILFKRVEVKK